MSRPPLLIHIPKTAGQAIVQSNLALPVNLKYINSRMRSIEEMDPNRIMEIQSPPPPFFKHIPYSYLDKSMLTRFDSVFTVVRNPWARMVSLYNYADKIRTEVKDEWFKQDHISFEEFLNRRLTFRMGPGFYRAWPYDQWASQSDWIIDGKNYAYKADVLRYEHLQEDLTNYLDKKVELPVVNKGIYENDYRSYYNEETYNAIADWFKVDIDRWGFTFESGATKNYWTP